MRFSRRPTRGLVAALALVVATCAAGCKGPSNDKQWSANQAVLPRAEFSNNLVTVHNVRNTSYRSADDYTVRHYDKTYDLEKLDSVDFIIVPFPDVPGGAHTFLSFGFDDKDYVAVSVEIRRRPGEDFAPIKSMTQPTEIMYVVGDERDLIQLRTIHWMSDVYMYRAQATKPQMQTLFTNMMKRANKLADEPEFYNLVTNNCTTNIMRHINEVSPGKVPYTYQVLFPAYSDQLAAHLKLIKIDGTLERTRQEARINEVAYVHRESPEFSAKIRAGHPVLAKKSWEVDELTVR
jgi:hypothetical protein